MSDLPLLSLVIWVPILGGVLVLGLSNNETLARRAALAVAVLTFLLSIPLFTSFFPGTASMQFVEDAPWIPVFDIRYHLGVDGIAMPLILLTTFTTILVVGAGWEVIKTRVAQYMAAFLIMEGLINGVFSALDAILFYVFWEAMLIPMFLIIGVWGGPRRIYASVKFFLYTFLGSVFMLVALIYLGYQADSFEILKLHDLPLAMTPQKLVFVAFFLAFAVKVPMWPVHTWLPDAHVEAPTGGSVILAAIMLKVGGYGFLRFSLPIAPDASAALAGVMVTLSLIAVVYIAFVALVQQDMKKLIAYSSISHMGFVTLGLFAMFYIFEPSVAIQTGTQKGAALGVEGAMVQMISHGFVSAALFLCVGVLYDRVHSREIATYKGVANSMPVFAALLVLFAMANAGLPGTSAFVGEFLVILGAFQANPWFAFLAATTLVLGAAYTLWMVKRVVYGEANPVVAKLSDLNRREFFILGSLAVLVLVLGVWPAPLLDVMHASVANLLQQVAASKL
jgi:NADH-quinone oxidoreductase subunit M